MKTWEWRLTLKLWSIFHRTRISGEYVVCVWMDLMKKMSINLTHCGLVTPYREIDLGQYWVRSWLIAWWPQTITWTNFDWSSREFCGIQLKAISQKMLKTFILDMSLNTHLWGTTESSNLFENSMLIQQNFPIAYYNTQYNTEIMTTKHRPDIELTKQTTYLAFTDQTQSL